MPNPAARNPLFAHEFLNLPRRHVVELKRGRFQGDHEAEIWPEAGAPQKLPAHAHPQRFELPQVLVPLHDAMDEPDGHVARIGEAKRGGLFARGQKIDVAVAQHRCWPHLVLILFVVIWHGERYVVAVRQQNGLVPWEQRDLAEAIAEGEFEVRCIGKVWRLV